MKKIFTLLSFCLLFKNFGYTQDRMKVVDVLLKKGNHYFNSENPNKKTDELADFYFKKVIAITPKTKEEAASIFEAYLNLGALNQSLDKKDLAKKHYNSALKLAFNYQLSDSLQFKPLLYLGSLHYYNFDFDSCYLKLDKAENLLLKYPKLPEVDRLFNTFGVLYFEAGNFRQSIQYFQKAINLRKGTKEIYDFSFRNNMASAMQFLKKPDSSLVLYQKLLVDFPEETSLKLNLASVYLDLNLPKMALMQMKSVKPTALNIHQTNYYNLMGKCAFAKNDYELAKQYFLKAIELGQSKKTNKNVSTANSYRYLGIIAENNEEWVNALNYYQQSIINLVLNFNDKDISKNPNHVEENFNSYSLLKSIEAKALCLKKTYQKTQNEIYFNDAVNSFEILLKLIKISAKTYNNENSRLDLKIEVHQFFQNYTDLLLSRYFKTNNNQYLKKAFEISDEGKAATLALSINEQIIKNSSDIPDSLLYKENLLNISKNAIIGQMEVADKTNLIKLNDKLNDLNVKISRLNAQLDKFPGYHKKKYNQELPINLNWLQNKLVTGEVILYYYEGISFSGVFLVTKNSFKFQKIELRSLVESSAKILLKNLKEINSGNGIPNLQSNKILYNYLIFPFEKELRECKNLIFIGDGKLNGFPIEILKNAENKYLIQLWPVSYLFAAKFISFDTKNNIDNIVAFAPFYAAKSIPPNLLLSNSYNEVLSMPNTTAFYGNKATKNSFFKNIENYQIVHLATHAVTNESNSDKSYIQFYTPKEMSFDSRLYLFELRTGLMKNNRLVFLSACESFGSQNIEGEGIMGLSRAFYLAGSKNIISSLWKAEDHTTAYISSRFYYHLSKGLNYAEALQMAKIDFLGNAKFAQFQNPKYWAHLVLVGNQLPSSNTFKKYAYILAGCFLVISIIFFSKSINF